MNIGKIVIFLFLIIFVPVHSASAQWTVTEIGPAGFAAGQTAVNTATIVGSTGAIAGSTAAAATTLGIISASVGIPGTSSAVLSGIERGTSAVVSAVCKGIEKSETIASAADNFSNFSLIGGSPAEATQITAKVNALIIVKTCREAMLEAYKNVPVANMLMGQELIRKQDVLNAEISSLSQRIESLRGRQSQTTKDVLKAVALKITLNLSQKLTTRMVNSLVAKYRIQNQMKYADAVATQIYTTDYINKNYSGNTQDQYILRSLMQNGSQNTGVLPMVQLEADKSLGFVPEELEFSDPNYYVKLSKTMTSQTNPVYRQMIYDDLLQDAKAQGQQNAKEEIAGSDGFMPVRNCSGSVAQQKSIDQKNNQLSYQVYIDDRVYQKMFAQYRLNPSPQTKEEFEKAAAALTKSREALKALPEAGASPFVSLCDGISNPGTFVSNSITGFLNKHFNEAGNIKSENIPFWGNFLSSVATNFVGNIIETGKPNLNILTQAGIQAGNIAAGDIVKNAGQSSELKAADKEFKFSFVKASTGSNVYTLTWDARDVDGATRVTIRGIGIGETRQNPQTGAAEPNNLPVSGSVNVQTSSSNSYLLKVYNTKGENIASQSLDLVASTGSSFTTPSGPLQITPSATKTPEQVCMDEVGDADYCRAVYGEVKGAFASKLTEPIRRNTISPRGSD